MKERQATMNDVKRGAPIIFLRGALALIVVCFFLAGCTLMQLHKDVQASMDSAVIVGHVYADFVVNGPLIVAACPTSEGKKIAHYTVLHDSGEYELMVGQGAYYVFAFRDSNSNLIYETGEPAGQYGNAEPVNVPAVGVVFDIDIVIPEEGEDIEIPHGVRIAPVPPPRLHSRQAGDITDLDDERFSGEYGAKGFWEPYAFFRELGGNIYFLEEYDPGKIPVLFIHGATGTPEGWRYFIDHLDRTRYQPWFFYYPTGARLESISYLLYWKLVNLQSKFQFNTMYITAHSMGGLVARSFIVNYGAKFPCVKLFVSLATPWGGDRMAEYGVRQSPVVIPSWLDMQPDGEFITSLYRQNLPDSVSFYMFYGYRGNRNPFRANNDGTITLSSLLDYRPQSEARMNYAFHEDHTSILTSKEVVEQFNAVLAAFAEQQSASLHRSGGYLKIDFAYDYALDGMRPRPTLILRPAGEMSSETVIFLNHDDNGRILGPFPPGDYLASMITQAGKPGKKYVPVSLASNETQELDFVFIPDGVIRGCVTASLTPEDKSVGMPDYRYRSEDEKIDILSVTLAGGGIYRSLEPSWGEEINDNENLIRRNDFCYNTCFGFFGLPAGDYTLVLHARGYRPVVKDYAVVPGILNYFRITELTAD